MKKTVMILMVAFLGTVLISGAAFGQMMNKYETLAKNQLAPIGHNKHIVKYTQEKNAKGETMDQINALDTKWKAADGVTDFMKPYLDGPCSDYLRQVVALVPYLSEIFVMDNQGALVCETDKTGDYMQGDEAKWQKSFNNGTGAIFVDKPEYDKGFGTDVLQISVPVMDGMKAIGAITFGVFADKVK